MSDWIDDLERKAKAATPGPWEVDDDDCGFASPDAPMVATPWVAGRRTHIVGSPARPHGKPLPEDAEFIAAANPVTILRLIGQVRRWKAAWEMASPLLTECDALAAKVAEIAAERDQWREMYQAQVHLAHVSDMKVAALTTDTSKEN